MAVRTDALADESGALPSEQGERREFTQEALELAAYEMDQLGLQGHARALADTLISLKGGSVVAVTGEWGQGKTSFLNMVRDYIRSDKTGESSRFDTVSIPLWKYEKASEAIYAIARDTQEQMLSPGDRVVRGLAGHGERSLSALSVLLRSLKIKPPGVPVEFGVSDSPEDMERRTKTIDRKNYVYREPVETWLGAFEKATAPDSGKEVIAFVDDVDRVQPDIALDLLEDLKMLLGNAGCRFVLALDHGVLRHAVAARYRRLGFDDPEQHAINYLDKLIDLTVCLPRLSVETAAAFLDRLTRDFPQHVDLSEAERCVLLAGVPLNPRAIKHVVAALYYEKRVEQEVRGKTSSGKGPKPSVATEAKRVKRLVLQLFFPRIVEWAMGNSEKFRLLQKGAANTPDTWLPELALPQEVRSDVKSRAAAQKTLTTDDERELMSWTDRYCPYIWGFLRQTPAISATDFGSALQIEGER